MVSLGSGGSETRKEEARSLGFAQCWSRRNRMSTDVDKQPPSRKRGTEPPKVGTIDSNTYDAPPDHIPQAAAAAPNENPLKDQPACPHRAAGVRPLFCDLAILPLEGQGGRTAVG